MYTHLFQLFHRLDHATFQKEYEKRINDYGAIKIPLRMKPMKFVETFDLFLMNTSELLLKLDRIHTLDVEIRELAHQLPKIAQQDFIHNNLIDELFHTNNLEGVKSTREEIVESTRAIAEDPNTSVRFNSMIRSYQKLLADPFEPVLSPKEIRDIYDDLVAEEVDKEEHALDGELFRADVTYVYKKSGTGKIIHKGVTPEKKIYDLLVQLLSFLNDDETSELPLLYRIAIAHYYFGYIHPFYDGNGRTSRFISSLYLKKELHPLTALSLSRGCNKKRKEYLDAFEQSNSFKNRGDLTYFCEVFFDIIIHSQIEIINELKENKQLLEHFIHVIKKQPLENKLQHSILFVLAQHFFFNTFEKGMTRKELAKATKASTYMITKEMNTLLEKGLIASSGARPVMYRINEKYFDL